MKDWYAKQPLAALPENAAHRWGPREAVRHEGTSLTFRQLQSEIEHLARGLIALGIEPGEKVVLWMPNRPEWIAAFFAISRIGAIAVPVNTRFRAVDLAYVLHQSDATTLITVDRSGPIDFLAIMAEVIPEIATGPTTGPTTGSAGGLHPAQCPALRRVVVLGENVPPGAIPWQALRSQAAAVAPEEAERRHRAVDPDATTLMLYTSGTTGFPKGVMHSHVIQRNAVDIGNRLGYRADDVILMNWPLFHIAGIYIGPFLGLVSGARVVLTTTFDPGESLRLIEEERVTRIWGFEAHLDGLLSHPNRPRTDFSSLRTGSAAVGMVSAEQVTREAVAHMGSFVSGWGMTEIGAATTVGFPGSPAEDTWLTSGYPLPGLEFKVIDPDTGEDVPHSTLGELCARGYSLMQGYYKKPEETAKAIDQEGWLHTGDLASMRADGAVRFLGRIKDLLKVGGENVDPTEVEAFLLTHPAIAQVQIVGIPDRRLSEIPCACVILKPGHSVTNDEITAFCRGKLASFKIPRHTIPMAEFPMTASGKPQKFRLREIASEAVSVGNGS